MALAAAAGPRLRRVVEIAPAGEHDGADRGQQQQQRGCLEGDEEAFQHQLADRRRAAEAGADRRPLVPDRLQPRAEDRDRELDEEGAAAQIVVYAGAVMVIYVFVAAYVGGIEEPMFDSSPALKIIGPILALALFVEISIAVLGSSLTALGTEGVDKIEGGFGTPEAIGKLMLEDFLIAFEAASLLLLIAAVAAIVLTGRKREAKDPNKGRTADGMNIERKAG